VLHARESGWIEPFDHEAQTAITSHDVQVVAQHDPACEVFEAIVGPLIPRAGVLGRLRGRPFWVIRAWVVGIARPRRMKSMSTVRSPTVLPLT
jgi:hypothetical protein